MICKACNAANEDGALFCANCGATLEQAPAAAPVYEAAPQYEVPAVDPGKTLGMVAMILGIVGLLLGTVCSCVCSCIGWVGPILSIVAIVLGIIANSKSKAAGFKNTMATVGLILGIVGIALGLITSILGLVLGMGSGFLSALTQRVGSSSYSDPYAYGYYGY